MRIAEIDIARGFTVLIMPAVHVLLLNSSLATQASLLGKSLAFLAEGPGAQLFMLLMGMSFTFSKSKGLLHASKKALVLLSAGYCLNFLKFDVPMLLGFMPDAFLNDLNLRNNSDGKFQLFALGDILQLAAISYTIIAVLYRLHKYYLWSALLAIVIIFLSPVFIKNIHSNTFIKYTSDLLFANSIYVFFPVFPWLAYSLAGLSLGYYIQKERSFFTCCRNIGLLLMITGKLSCLLYPTSSCDNFYKPCAGATFYHLGFVLLWLYLIHIVITINRSNSFFKLLFWLSRNITTIYLLQWICIFWMIDIAGYHDLDVFASFIYMILITIIVFSLTRLLEYLFIKQVT